MRLTPSKIVCIGRNYVDHIKELGNETPEDMVIFLKPPSALCDELYSFEGEGVEYEGELCFLYEKGSFSAVGFGLDLTKRALQNRLKTKGLPWERAKAFDKSAVFGEFVPIDNLEHTFSFELFINDVKKQEGSSELMIYHPTQILSTITSFMSLEDGDIVMSGTPKGVGVFKAGDLFVARLFQDGRLIDETRLVVSV